MNKYYVNSDGQVFAYASDGSEDAFISGDMREIEEEEAIQLTKIPVTAESVRIARMIGYADPVTGSDRMFSEAMRMNIMGEDGYQDVRAAAIKRFNEIQEANPWPEDSANESRVENDMPNNVSEVAQS